MAVPAAEVRVVIGDLGRGPDLDLDDRRKGGQEQADHARRSGGEKRVTQGICARWRGAGRAPYLCYSRSSFV